MTITPPPQLATPESKSAATAPPFLFTPISHIGASVPDIDAAVAWYRDTLGFTVLHEPITVDESSPIASIARDIYGPRWQAMRQAHLSAGNNVGLELFQFLTPATAEPSDDRFDYTRPGFFHLCVVSRDIGALVERVVAAGGQQRTAIHHPSSRYALCYCADPWGNAIEINDHSYEYAHAQDGPPPHPPAPES